MMTFNLKIVGPRPVKPLGEREQDAKNIELANALKIVADTIANTGSSEGQIRNGDLAVT
jgi:hypothetical protein